MATTDRWRRRFASDVAVAALVLLSAGALWALQWRFSPRWLVRSTEGMQTLLQVVPPTIAAVYALGLASVFVIAQVLSPNRGARSVGLLLLDLRVRVMFASAILLVVAGLFLSGAVTTSPPAWLTSAGATIVEMGCAFIVGSTLTLASMLQQYTSPDGFGRLLLGRFPANDPGAYKRRARILRQWMRSAARHGESRELHVAADALLRLFDSYVEAARRRPALRLQEPLEGGGRPSSASSPGWFGEEASRALVRAAEDAVRANALWRDLDRLVSTLARLVTAAVRAGLLDEARRLLCGLTEVGLFAARCTDERQRRWFVRPALALARLGVLSDGDEPNDLPAYALAGWALIAVELEDDRVVEMSRPHLRPTAPWDLARTPAIVDRLRPGWYVATPDGGDRLAALMRAARESAAVTGSPRSGGVGEVEAQPAVGSDGE